MPKKPDYFNERYDQDIFDKVNDDEVKKIGERQLMKKQLMGGEDRRIKKKMDKKEKPSNFGERIQMEIIREREKPLERKPGPVRKGSPLERESGPVRKGSPLDRDYKGKEKEEPKKKSRPPSDKAPSRMIAANDDKKREVIIFDYSSTPEDRKKQNEKKSDEYYEKQKKKEEMDKEVRKKFLDKLT